QRCDVRPSLNELGCHANGTRFDGTDLGEFRMKQQTARSVADVVDGAPGCSLGRHLTELCQLGSAPERKSQQPTQGRVVAALGWGANEDGGVGQCGPSLSCLHPVDPSSHLAEELDPGGG